MCKFKTDMRVVVIAENNEVRKGVICRLFESMEIAIVKFDDGNVEKVHFSYLGIEPETKVQEEKSTKPVEKSEITITPGEFKKIALKIIAEESRGSLLMGIVLGQVVANIHEALFVDAVDND